MAFLDNSGDIILDAVFTDTGRFRLARGDGSFKITTFQAQLTLTCKYCKHRFLRLLQIILLL